MIVYFCGLFYFRDRFDEEGDRPVAIDIDIGLSAHANAKKYFSQKKHASQKEKKTIDASTKALKSAERKTKQALKEMKVTANIVKARKVCGRNTCMLCFPIHPIFKLTGHAIALSDILNTGSVYRM